MRVREVERQGREERIAMYDVAGDIVGIVVCCRVAQEFAEKKEETQREGCELRQTRERKTRTSLPKVDFRHTTRFLSHFLRPFCTNYVGRMGHSDAREV